MQSQKSIRTIFFIFLMASLVFLSSQCLTTENSDSPAARQNFTPPEKQKGAHVFGRIDSTNYLPLAENNIEWITLVGWASQEDFDSPEVRYIRGDSLELVEQKARWLNRVHELHEFGFKVFVKPHVWIHAPTEGKWRSDIYFENEEEWAIWSKSYHDFIMHYAMIAAESKAEMFCVGTELTRLSLEKPEFWKTLIRKVRTVYSGKLTYAANWYAEYEQIAFWEDLDFIGIQAYFPLAKIEYPTVEEVSKGWEQYLPTLESMARANDRKILFTEMGYKSTAGSAIEPWAWVEDAPVEEYVLSNETQAHCYQAFFDKVWPNPWFSGVHIWQMRSDFSDYRGQYPHDFTPQGKIAEQILKEGFE